MSRGDARPAPLRVPVGDVAIRSSIVGQRRREPLHPSLVVVQRPVHYISGAPSASADDDAARALELQPLAEVQRALEQVNDAAEQAAIRALSRPAPLDLDVEVATTGDDEEADDAEELDLSLPPPAPPEALRRTPSSPNGSATHHASASLSPAAEEPSAPESALAPGALDSPELPESLEELDLDLDTRMEPANEQLRLPSPPPPPPPARAGLPSLPEPSPLTRTARVQELRPTKPRTHAWWEVFFDDDYLRTVRTPSAQQIGSQCDFIEKRLGLKPGASVLDVGCGLGQHVIELTARGYASVGVDLSLAMLARAAEEAQSRGMRINFLHADMRELGFEASFDAVTCLGTSLGYFDDETNRKVMERLLRALKPGGALLLDVVNRDHVIRSQPNLIWFEGEGCVCMEESEFNFFTSRLHVKRTVILDSGRQLEHEYSLRLYSLHELGQLMHASGFRVSEVSGRGGLPGVFFGQESPNLMIVAERRSDKPGAAAHANADERGGG